jgi:protein-L-isoaspartate(D-aspartate) O-methyltransferase
VRKILARKPFTGKGIHYEQKLGRAASRQEAEMMDFQAARRAMVDGQIRTSDVTDTCLLAAMLAIPREVFVPDHLAGLAYLDCNLPVDGGGGAGGAGARTPAQAERFLVKPMVQARLIQATRPAGQDRVLVVGCGTGYSAAVFGRLAGTVMALDENESLLRRSRAALAQIGLDNVTVVSGPLPLGWPAASPYDVILIDGGVEFVPGPLFDQLARRGRLATAMGAGPVGRAMLFVSDDKGEVSGRALCDATVPVLPGFKKAPTFVF